ncbi:putative F-box/FBD/LRR-repeat protein [Cardamine amara subsp. amara]|uniref:F-box/FBD/LRR-repeat protein n=1 Tax=Cardamine amara subsp. amara TaxID=228776 RepID=A0ABD1APC8_CARAN
MGCVTICDLPDSLLTQILLNLPTKDSVKTSVLSTQWRNLWLSVPGLDLATYHCPRKQVLASFMERFIELNHGSPLQIFKIWIEQYHYVYRDRLMELIGTVVNRGIQHLDITMLHCNRDDFIRQNIYKSKTLVSLKLVNVELKNPEFVVVSLPCLKIIKLEKVCYGKDGALIVEKLISGCPVLEDLELIRPFDILNEKLELFLRVSCQTLKRCCLAFARGDTNFTVEIDAPRLEYLSLSESQSDRIVVKNLSSLLVIGFKFKYGSHLQTEDLRKRGIFCKLLTGISTVRRMSICEWTLEVLNWYSELGPIPKFHNLYHLQVMFYKSSFQLLTAFLESCPNLKKIVLDYGVTSKPEQQIDLTNVPCCLTSTLEYVEIRELIVIEEVETGIIKLVNYFLENSAILKKLTLSSRYSYITNQEGRLSYKKLTSTRLSPTCQVIIGNY